MIRGSDGKVFALENRRAHRQVPLTKGVVQGRTVKCGYHGWAYDAARINAYHGRLKEWLRHFHDVATKNLPNYLG